MHRCIRVAGLGASAEKKWEAEKTALAEQIAAYEARVLSLKQDPPPQPRPFGHD